MLTSTSRFKACRPPADTYLWHRRPCHLLRYYGQWPVYLMYCWMTHQRNRGSIAGTDKRVISSPKQADRPWCWHSFSAEVKNKESSTSIPEHTFMSCTTTTLHLACWGHWCFGPRHKKTTRNLIPWLILPQNISAAKKSKTWFSCLGNLTKWTTWKQRLKFFNILPYNFLWIHFSFLLLATWYLSEFFSKN
jgi:hypothetical protein